MSSRDGTGAKVFRERRVAGGDSEVTAEFLRLLSQVLCLPGFPPAMPHADCSQCCSLWIPTFASAWSLLMVITGSVPHLGEAATNPV